MSTTRDFLATDDETDLIPEEVITAEEEETAEHQEQEEIESMLAALEETKEENAELEEKAETESMLAALEETEEEELSDAPPLEEQKGFAQRVLEDPFLAHFDECEQKLGLSPIWIRHQLTEVQLYLTVDVANLVVIRHDGVVQLTHVAGYDLGGPSHDKGQGGDPTIGAGGNISSMCCRCGRARVEKRIRKFS